MKHYCVISHTHWDREWYQTQEEFRMRLIDLMDHLLEILDNNADYVFHMDAQTIVFEDYWKVRPEMKEKCCQYIREGRILAGPWYVQNDFYLTSGEATVRNLLLGTKQAEEMGRCGKTGYAPDQFGLISQLPQILKGFEIDHCVFGRGYKETSVNENGELIIKHKPAEFIWKSPDGSEVLAICMSHWYNNAQRFSADTDRAFRLVQNVKESFEGIATTPYLLLMNGVDHLEPQGDLLPILDAVQKRLPEDEKIYQTSLEEYAELVRGTKAQEEMTIEVGELMQGTDKNLLKDTASARTYLKIMNSELQNMLEHRLEPLYALLEMKGMDGIYPSGHLDYLWKMLIKNHAHDSICGCSKDAVHDHMEDRFKAIKEMGDELQRRGMKQLAAHVRKGLKTEDYEIVVFNGLEHERTELIEITIDVVSSDNPKGIRIISADGQEIPFKLLKQYSLGKSIFSAINLPGTIETTRYEVRMLAKNIPAFGYVVYRVVTNEQSLQYESNLPILSEKAGKYCMENEYLKVVVSGSGKVDLYNKESGRCYPNVLTVQDIADLGNTYIFTAMVNDVPVDIADFTPEIKILESDEYVGKLGLHYEVTLPAYYDVEHERRSAEMVTMPLDISLCLKKEAKSLDISFEVDNRAKDHRMSAWIRTGINSSVVTATSPYDIITRDKWDINTLACNETEHTSGMVAISHGQEGIAVLNRGIYAYEHLQQEQGTLTFPIVRSTGAISAGVQSDDDAWRTPGNQCLRKMCAEISLMPQCGEHLAEEAAFAAKAFQNPLLTQCEPVDTRKFLGGRPAVQDTEIAEMFYQEVPYQEVQLERMESILGLDGSGLQVTALKKSFDRTGYIFRFFNPREESVNAVFSLGNLQIKEIYKTNLKETMREQLELNDNKITMCVKAKEIVTLYMGGF